VKERLREWITPDEVRTVLVAFVGFPLAIALVLWVVLALSAR
jgi:hypothetical protein